MCPVGGLAPCEEIGKGFLHKKGGGVGAGVADGPEGLGGFGHGRTEAQGVRAGGEVLGLQQFGEGGGAGGGPEQGDGGRCGAQLGHGGRGQGGEGREGIGLHRRDRVAAACERLPDGWGGVRAVKMKEMGGWKLAGQHLSGQLGGVAGAGEGDGEAGSLCSSGGGGADAVGWEGLEGGK